MVLSLFAYDGLDVQRDYQGFRDLPAAWNDALGPC